MIRGCFFPFAFASSSLAVCHNTVQDKVGLNCAVIWRKKKKALKFDKAAFRGEKNLHGIQN